ncbi:MAG: ferredoxin--NADP reductase [Pseudobdellovibrionaceae bacterium]|nr:ferredoxin--NADP reductase [Bdellovibrionales bacterium]USN46573.1 MAG: ferredoxin--NADP reductase [Pseudobdellovibrionaceae bacterium]
MSAINAFVPLKIVEIVEETTDCKSFFLQVPQNEISRFKYKPGQFISVKMDIHGESLTRSYSLASTPDEDPDLLQITVKKVEGGRVSTFMVEQLKEGQILIASPPAGNFVLEKGGPKNRHIFLLAGGSGITPLFSMLKHVLASERDTLITLLYASRSDSQVIFKQALSDLEAQYISQLEIYYIYSKPEGEALRTVFIDDENLKALIIDKVEAVATSHHLHGRLSRNNLETLLQNCRHARVVNDIESSEYYICGPDGLMEVIGQTLKDLSVDPGHIHVESFTTSEKGHLQKGFSKEEDLTVITADSNVEDETAETLVVELDGQTLNLEYKDPKLSITETLLEAGHNPPYSCLAGTCMACLAKLKEGRVYQDDPGILTDEAIAAGEILTCQARPLTKIVRVDFDEV